MHLLLHLRLILLRQLGHAATVRRALLVLSYGREGRLEVERRGNYATEDRLHHLMVGDTLWLVPVEGVRAVDHRLWEGLLKIADLLVVSHLRVCGDITARAPEHLTLSFIGVPAVV